MFSIKYQKISPRSSWKTLPNADFFSLMDAVQVTEHLSKVVYHAVVENEKGKVEFDGWSGYTKEIENG